MARVTVVANDPPSPTWTAIADDLSRRHQVRPTRIADPRLDEWLHNSDIAVYHVDGDAGRSGAVYRRAVRKPGIVVLHDLDLEELIRGLVREGDPNAEPALREAGADRARISGEELGGNNRLLTPWCAQLVRRARAVVTHSRVIATYLGSTRSRTPVFVAPHPMGAAPDADRGSALRAGVAGAGELLVVTLCDPSAAPLLGRLVEAIDENVRLVVVGTAAEVAGIGDRVTVPDPESRGDVRAWVVAADLVVNLGSPAREEAREFTAAAQAAGKASVLGAPWFGEGVPADGAVQVAAMPDAEELRAALARLTGDPAERDRLGRRLRDDALARCTNEAAADVHAAAVDRTLALLDDPIRSAVGRWASALAEFGATVDTARQGLGARFPDEIAAIADAS